MTLSFNPNILEVNKRGSLSGQHSMSKASQGHIVHSVTLPQNRNHGYTKKRHKPEKL